MSIDAEKAFDSVNWTFLYKVLKKKKVRFYEKFVNNKTSLYQASTTRIKINSNLLRSFNLERAWQVVASH